MRHRTKHELRCFCRGEPLLATYGVDRERRLYVHIKVYKQGKVYGEIIATGGPLSIRCRNCLRWHKVMFRASGSVELEEDKTPEV